MIRHRQTINETEAGRVFYVSRQGVARVWLNETPAVTKLKTEKAREAARIKAVRASGHVPAARGPDIAEAPGRGPTQMFEAKAMYPKGEDGFALKPSGHRGRKALRCTDSFDVMALQAARRKSKDQPKVSLSPTQVAMGRYYRDLHERHACAGVRCSSIDGMPGGGGTGGTGGGFIDAVLRDGQELDKLRRRIGDGSAMVVRRQRPSARGSRRTILDRRLVDQVCIGDGTISDVLRAHGWSVNGRLIKALTLALANALERMNGPVHQDRVAPVHFGAGQNPIWDVPK